MTMEMYQVGKTKPSREALLSGHSPGEFDLGDGPSP